MFKMANLSLAVLFLMLITTVSVLNQMLLIIVKQSNSFFEHSREKGKIFGKLSKSINVSSSLIIASYFPLKLGYLVSVFATSKTSMSSHNYVTLLLLPIVTFISSCFSNFATISYHFKDMFFKVRNTMQS